MAPESHFIPPAKARMAVALASPRPPTRAGLILLIKATPAPSASLDQLFPERRYIELEAALKASPTDDVYFRGLLANRRNAATDSIAKLESVLPALEKARESGRLKTAYYV